jgi:hypothetical protein
MRNHRLALLAMVCALLIPSSLRAQVDVIRGRVTNVEGQPLAGVRITATSIPGSVTRTTRTDARGGFQIAFPGGQGDYMMGYALVGYAYRQFEIKRTVDQDVLVADTRLQPMQLDTVVTTAPVQQRISRFDRTPDVSGTEQQVAANALPPDQQGNLALMAASLPGVTLIPGTDGAADGFSVLGLGADANTTTLNGMQFGANGLPRDAAVSSSLTTSPYDPSRGGFSGGNLNLRSGSGSNLRTRGLSLVTNMPQLQWTDRAARSLGTEYTSLSLGGLASGPIRLNKAFYNVSYQIDHNQRPNQTLLNTGTLGFVTAGVAPDSVSRFLSLLDGSGVPRVAGPSRAQRFSDNGSLFGSIDIQPPNAINGDSYGIAFNGNWGRQSPVGGGATQLAAASGDRLNWGGGAQLRTNRYFGLILSESSVGVNVSRDWGEPYLDLPAGRVRVNSLLDNGASGVQTLAFGGSQSLFSASRSVSGSAQNTLSWFDDANKHRIKLTTELQYSTNKQNIGSNLLGTFSYNSLADFESGRPSSFTRQLTARQRSTGQATLALALGDSWRRTPNVQIQYGVRAEHTRYAQAPQYNADIERVFGRRNDKVPTPISLSPRVGFSWTLGQSQEILAFSGGFRPPRVIIRGGIGMFTNGASAGSLGSAIDNTGLASGVQQLVCTGDAVPVPQWGAFGTVQGEPDHCADGTGATEFSNTSPNVVLLSPSLRPQRSVRSNLSWQGPVLDARFSLNAEATWSLNLNQQQSVDINFRGVPQFTLAAEGNRPVYVPTSSIDELTGAVAARGARVSDLFNRVSDTRSDLRSSTAQLSLRLSPIPRTPQRFGWNAAYTLTAVREQVGGFQNTAGDPLLRAWSRASNGPHQISYSLRYNFFDYVTVNWSGQFRSGAAFTPMVGGDINGDGYGNDRAFVYDPSTVSDASLRAGLQQLMGDASASTRKCLERQMGQVAQRNSCRAPWSSTASLTMTLDRSKFRMPQRAAVNFSVSNPLGAADLALNGSGKLKGWGQNPFPDQSLFYVRGFDPVTKKFTYEVNQRFGQTRPQFLTLRSPVTMTVSVRIDLGATRERQGLGMQLAQGRTMGGSTRASESQLRSFGSGNVLNPMTQIIRQQDSLRLTAVQADSIASMNRRYTYRVDSLWTPVARYLATLPTKYGDDEAYERYLRARRTQIDMLTDAARALNDLLTPQQKRRLPGQIVSYLDPRFLNLIRDGNGLYVGSGGANMGFVGSQFVEFAR